MTSSQKEESIPTGKSVEAYRRFLNMKNREYRVLVTLALMASLVVGNIAGTSVNVQAADNKDKSTETKKTSETKTSSSATPTKDETVYVKVDDAGNQKDVTVSDQLKNISSLGTIDDVSDLKDIKNVKGDETFSENNGKLVWQGDKKDICYQGTTTKKIPVGMKVTYELDGKKVSADDLEGKSGHLKIHYEYQNTSADSGKYTPFLMATGLLMDGEKFSNVTVDNGKVISDGDRNIVIGMGLPQLKEQLTSVSSKVDDLDIPDSFTVEADVTDYEKVEAVTVATNEVFNEVGTDKFDSLDELKDSMTELQDASNKLVSGSGELKDGLDTLLSSSGTLVSGIDQLASGGNTLASGTGSLVSGMQSAKTGSSQLAGGVKALSDGVSGMQAQVSDGVKDLSNGVSSVQAGVETIHGIAEQADKGVDLAKDGAKGLCAGLETASESAGEIATAARNLCTVLGGNQQTVQVEQQQEVTVDNSDIYNQIAALAEQMTDENDKAAVENVLNQISATKTQTVDVQAEVEVENPYVTALNGIASGADALSKQLSANGEIGGGAATLYGTLSSTQGATVKAATAGLSGALASDGSLQRGISLLQSGVGEMGTKLGAGTNELLSGIGTLQKGADSLDSGLGTLTSGASQLNSGAGTLSTGLNTLQSSTGALVSGVEQLDSGAAELNSGMIQFNEEGIEKLVSVFDGDIDALLDKANELLDASKEYKNFSGIADGMDGSVKFIFVSDK
jgi:putative membrane protein